MRAYDPTLGRFLSRDPLGRAPLMGWSDQPYAYAGNNPLTNVDPSGQRYATESGAQASAAMSYQRHVVARGVTAHGAAPKGPTPAQIRRARAIANTTAAQLQATILWAGVVTAIATLATAAALLITAQAATNPLEWLPAINFGRLAAALGLFAAQSALLAAEATVLAVEFSTEAGQADSWWSGANVRGFGLKLGGIIAGFSVVTGLLGLVVKAYAALGAGVFGAIALVGQALVSFVGFGVLVAGAIKSEENALQ